jgi:predicted DsbA family dithiol-disulfide isomerase
VSGQDFLTLGLEPATPPLEPNLLPDVVHNAAGEGVPVAVFGDFFCPFCRILMARVRTLQDNVRISWHELPLLGPGSVLVARASQAAHLQGGYLDFYDTLAKAGFRPSDAWMVEVADRTGLDTAKFRSDLGGEVVERMLKDSAAAAARLGLFATPGIVIGRKAVLGAIDQSVVQQLIKDVQA